MPKLQIIVASTRPGRAGLPVAEWFRGLAEQHGGFELEVVDLAEVALPFLDEPEHPSERQYTKQHTRDWSASVDSADAFVFVMPEYNNGFSAPLKNAIDFLYYEWQYKPVGFVSYGNTSAGTRAVQMLKPVVSTLKMIPLTETVAIHFIGSHIEGGRFNATKAMETAAKGMLDELRRVADALAPVRAQDAS